MTSEPQPAPSAHERAAQAIIEYSQGQFVANEVHDIAELLHEFFPPAPAEPLPDHIADAGKMVPAPSAEPSVVSDTVPVPTVPGWYECRHLDATVERQVRWCEDGMSYPFHPRQSWQAGKVEYYADFRRLVPAAGLEELVRENERLRAAIEEELSDCPFCEPDAPCPGCEQLVRALAQPEPAPNQENAG